MLDTHPPLSEPSLVDSVIRVLEAGQRLVLDRVDLLRFDLSQLAARTLGGAVLIGVGAFLLAGAWFMSMGAVVVWLQQYLSLSASLAAVAAATAGVGAGAIAIGIRRGQIDTAGDGGKTVRAISEEASGTNGTRRP